VPTTDLSARLLCALGVLACLPCSGAAARKQDDLRYRVEQVWTAAVRLLRVDLKLAVTDRDQEGGYVMFDYVANGKHHAGSIELVAQPDAPAVTTTVVVQVQGMPSYVEQMILDRLEKKLRTEVGPPAKPPKPAPSPVAPPPEELPDAGSPPELVP
jgi:hypothetical protein